jgi:hypothetical protein
MNAVLAERETDRSTVTSRDGKPPLPYRYEPLVLQPVPRTRSLADSDMDLIVRAIQNGHLITEIATALGRDHSTLLEFLSASHRSARIREARRQSAIWWDEQAEKVVDALPSDATPADMLKVREKASHYRWRAKCIAPSDYGDRQIVQTENPDGDQKPPADLLSAAVQIAAAAGLGSQLAQLLAQGKLAPAAPGAHVGNAIDVTPAKVVNLPDVNGDPLLAE